MSCHDCLLHKQVLISVFNKSGSICLSDPISHLTYRMLSLNELHAADKLKHQSAGRVTIQSEVIQLCVAMPQRLRETAASLIT